MIYTSYFFKPDIMQTAKQLNMKLVSVALSHPKWFMVAECIPELNPTWNMINEYKRTHNEQQYIAQYQIILDKLNPSDTVTRLNNSILLCWEKPNEFCHRHLIADWLNDANPHTQIKEL